MNCFLKGASGRLILLLDRLYFFQLPNMPQQLGSDPELFQVKAGSGASKEHAQALCEAISPTIIIGHAFFIPPVFALIFFSFSF